MLPTYHMLRDIPRLMEKPRKVYLATSWRNEAQPAVLGILRLLGHEVYDFRNPGGEAQGFAWHQTGWHAANNVAEFIESMGTDRAKEGFKFDKDALDWCDTCVMLQPCGKSAHMEAGYAAGQGKYVIWMLSDHNFEPELMYGLGNAFVTAPNVR